MKLPLKLKRLHPRGLRLLAIALTSVLLIVLPVQAAEQLYLNYGPLGFSIPIHDLETFVQDGKAEGKLGYYLAFLGAKQKAQIQGVLKARYEVSPIVVSQFSYTSSGEHLLREVGELIKTPARQNGFRGIRAAAILAAADSQGLSVINFLHQFPTDMQIDIGQLLRLRKRIASLIQQTAGIVADLEQQTATIAASESTSNFNQLPDLRQPGEFRATKQTLTLRDANRDRQLVTDLYLPEPPSLSASQIPVIVVSNGLGARRDHFDELAQHLTSHGFAVAIPDHPGSDRQRLQNFYAGLYPENFDASEFVDRPLDITYLLNELEQRNQTEFQNRLNLQQVGIFGYSFGGTTALSLAGAEINTEQLNKDCNSLSAIVNISLLYQCRALELTQQSPNLRDDRIKAVYLFVPFGKSLFGQTGMSHVAAPVLWEATDQDILTPFVVEQVPTFKGLTISDRYLAVSKGLPHARLTLDVLNRLTNQSTVWEKLGAIAQTYHNALSVAFFKFYVAQDEQYRPYLQASYAEALTEKPYSLSFVQSLPSQSESVE